MGLDSKPIVGGSFEQMDFVWMEGSGAKAVKDSR